MADNNWFNAIIKAVRKKFEIPHNYKAYRDTSWNLWGEVIKSIKPTITWENVGYDSIQFKIIETYGSIIGKYFVIVKIYDTDEGI